MTYALLCALLSVYLLYVYSNLHGKFCLFFRGAIGVMLIRLSLKPEQAMVVLHCCICSRRFLCGQ